MRTYKIIPLAGLAALSALAATQILSSSAEAVAVVDVVTIPANFALVAGAEAIGVEGKVTGWNALTTGVNPRSVTIDNGTVIRFPSTIPGTTTPFKIDTNGDAVGDVTYDQLFGVNQIGTAFAGLRSPLGGTMIINATMTINGNTATFTADDAFFEFAENVVVGPVVGVNLAAGTCQIAGTTVRLSTDPRFPGKVTDLGRNQIQLSDLAGWEGSLATAEGYMENGVLTTKLLETEVIIQGATDTVLAERGLLTLSKAALDVRGVVTRYPQNGPDAALRGRIADSVQLTLSNGQVFTATVIPDLVLGQGTWRLRTANNSVIGQPTGMTIKSVFNVANLQGGGTTLRFGGQGTGAIDAK